MYKVFINNLPVFLVSHPNEVPVGTGPLRYTDCPSADKAHELITERLNQHCFYGIALLHHNVEELFKWCFEGFKYIEAAGGVVRNAEGKYLFIFRSGKWDLPKGKLEKGEDRAVAALREVEEECGITGHSIVSQLQSSWHVYALKDGRQAIKVTFWYLMNYPGNEKLKPQTEEGITAVEWLGTDELDKVYANTFRSITEVIHEGVK